MKKILSFIIALFLGTCLFAYDGTVFGGLDGSYLRSAWVSEAENTAIARQIVEEVYGSKGHKTTKFYAINKDKADTEDLQVIDDIEEYIDDEYGVQNKQAFSHIVIRSDTGDYIDGWIILSHYANKDGFLHYTYYFCVK